MKPRGITNLGEWVSWDPHQGSMLLHKGGTWVFAGDRLGEYLDHRVSDPDFVDAEERCLTPGLIDPHTHPAFGEDRALEFEMRAQGKSYSEIAAAGGGIRNSVRTLRLLDKETLTRRIAARFELMLRHGTTTVEAKSGYGLSLESERMSLQAITTAAEAVGFRVKRTFLGAHEIPDEYREDRATYLDLLIHEMIPRLAEEGLAEFCDVFCEEGVYTPEESRAILAAAKEAGYGLRIHADEFISTGGAELAAEMGALSADHLMAISDAGIKALAESGTVATLLPGTTFFLGQTSWAPARKLLDGGATLALATDFNPGSSMTVSLPMIMNLAVTYLHLTPLEALAAVTHGAARALGLDGELGMLRRDAVADLVLWDCRSHREIPYFYGVNQVHEVFTAAVPRGFALHP